MAVLVCQIQQNLFETNRVVMSQLKYDSKILPQGSITRCIAKDVMQMVIYFKSMFKKSRNLRKEKTNVQNLVDR